MLGPHNARIDTDSRSVEINRTEPATMPRNKADPYAELGVTNNATQADITNAYRRKARKAHPDMGGDLADMKRLTVAYDAIGDEDRRKRFDETGKTGEPPGQIATLLVNTLNQVLLDIRQQGADPERADITSRMEAKLAKQKADCLDKAAEYRGMAEKFGNIAARFESTGEENILASALTNDVADLTKQAILATDHAALFERCLVALKDYTYNKAGGEEPKQSELFASPANVTGWRVNFTR